MNKDYGALLLPNPTTVPNYIFTHTHTHTHRQTQRDTSEKKKVHMGKIF
jgi:hypothetical protein